MIIGYFLQTWMMEWVGCISRVALENRPNQAARIRQLADALRRWALFYWIVLVIGLIAGVVFTRINSSGRGFLFILVPGFGLGAWLAYVVIEYWRRWIADSTAWVESQHASSTLAPLGKTLRNWFMALLIFYVIDAVRNVVSPPASSTLSGTTGFVALILSLIGSVLSVAVTWYWREFFGAFTAHATATPAPSTSTNPASL